MKVIQKLTAAFALAAGVALTGWSVGHRMPGMPDGTIYAGASPDTGKPIFTTLVIPDVAD